MHRALVLLAAGFSLSACATDAPEVVRWTSQFNNTPAEFAYCNAPGCGAPIYARFTAAEWGEIAAPFANAADAAGERQAMTLAIQRFEQLVCVQGGTCDDLPETDMFGDNNGPGQTDCFAEAANTTVALQMLAREGRLKFHTVGEPGMRGLPYGTIGLVHATATVIETATGVRYAIDSWFSASGGPVYAVTFDTWRATWTPPRAARPVS